MISIKRQLKKLSRIELADTDVLVNEQAKSHCTKYKSGLLLAIEHLNNCKKEMQKLLVDDQTI